MLKRISSHLSYSNLMATIAVFVALGGSAVAVTRIDRNSVGARQLKAGAVTNVKLRKNSVGRNKVRRGTVNTRRLANNAVSRSKLRNGAVGRAELANGAVGAAELANGAVGPGKIQPNAVGTSEIADGSVNNNDLAPGVTPLIGPLKPGQTLRGMFHIGGTAPAAGEAFRTSQTYQFPLGAPLPGLPVQVLNPGATTPLCPGLAGGNQQTPQAVPGVLCIYITDAVNLAANGLTVPAATFTRLGFGLRAEANVMGETSVTGQWAVTAP